MATPFVSSMKTVLVMGGSYGGIAAAKFLSKELPEGYKVVLLERNRVVHGTATKLERNCVTFTPASYAVMNGEAPTTDGTRTIEFDYLIYALGARLPGPIDFWGAKSVYEKSARLTLEKGRIAFNGTKPASISFLKTAQKRLKEVESVLVVGGGALGIQFASDLKDLYPQKQITLLHSRTQLLPKFPEKMHDE
ncbi:hypothetical protein FRC11_002866, partial [Ceratobasidium sp. 423]